LALRGDRLRQPGRRGDRLRFRPGPGVPLRCRGGAGGRCDVRRAQAAGGIALVRAARAEDRRAAGHGHRRRTPVRRRRAVAPGWAKGLLVSPLAGFADYQRQRAWTWEHQALVRARCVAGDPGLCARFESVRDGVLAQARDPEALRTDVVAMRARMRAELDRTGPGGFDLKQGEAGLVDL